MDRVVPESLGIMAAKRPWPKTLPEQAQAVRAVLAEYPNGLSPEQLARLFLRANTKLVADLLQTLVSLGQRVRWKMAVTSGTDAATLSADLLKIVPCPDEMKRTRLSSEPTT